MAFTNFTQTEEKKDNMLKKEQSHRDCGMKKAAKWPRNTAGNALKLAKAHPYRPGNLSGSQDKLRDIQTNLHSALNL